MSLPSQVLPRHVEPEWLDHLPADDPRAIRSRRDLRWINAMMLQAGIMARALADNCPDPPRTILDLGSGDGTFMLAVARRLASRWRNVTVRMLDRQQLVTASTCTAFAALQWRAEPVPADILELEFLQHGEDADAITANLVLHHFDAPELSQLFRHASRRARLLIACEPWRAQHALLLSRMLWLIGCNAVTRHDAAASVRAGFRDHELSALWPRSDRWSLEERPARLFTHLFVASRR